MSLVSDVGLWVKLWWFLLVEWCFGEMDDVYKDRTFIIIEDYTRSALWNDIVLSTHRFKTLPNGRGWRRACNVLIPRGNWTLAHYMEPLMNPRAYDPLGIEKPKLSEMPVFLTLRRGVVVRRQDNVTLEQVLTAINE